MERSMEISPSAKLPLILTSVCTKLRELGGLDTPCIFRVDVEPHILKQQKEKLLQNDYSHNYSDPHIAACLLKDWIKNLKEALIPHPFYDRAIQMVKEQQLYPQTVQQFIAELPILHRESISYLIKFLKELTAEEHVQHNKMNIANISLMFGTIIFKCPSDQPTVIIAQASLQTAFTKACIQFC
eukprot:CAMPEP_0197025510 /NCGR_PEP_ID=MMETSP1384-20130603/5821_1 /TAXON_ID=29189 /ORGANISM="Ammonia sp." /LENGTH=183 /DNA_ID=CAMNT_0042454045 /DNA_START=110 /DNA_END=661 /DNA_ORIENTATION=+